MSSPNVGRITQVIGSTLDAQFSEESMPALYTALSVQVERTVLGEKTRETLWCEVAQHLGGGQVRAVSLGSTDGLRTEVSGEDVKEGMKVVLGEVRKSDGAGNTVNPFQPQIFNRRRSE